jgi:hypothetical protein
MFMIKVVISDSNPIHYQDASTLASLIRTKQLSSREVVQAHLDRVAAVNPKINAVVTLMADEALKGADAADKAVAEIRLGELTFLDTAHVLDKPWTKTFQATDQLDWSESFDPLLITESTEPSTSRTILSGWFITACTSRLLTSSIRTKVAFPVT